MASPKKRINPLLIALLVVVLLLVAVVGGAFAFLNNKVSALQQGATFTFRYEITPNSAQTSPLLSILQRVNASNGSVSGQYAPDKLQLSFYALNEDNSVQTSPFTRLYIDSDETLFDVGQIYSVLRQSATEKLPIAGALLPDWTLGDYISQTQLATVLGVDTSAVELQDLSGFHLALTGLKKVSPSGAREGYLYFQLPAGADGTTVILGIDKSSIFSDTIPLHVVLTIPEHNVRVHLTGTITAARTVLSAPESRMQDSDVAAFAQIRQSLESIWQMIQSVPQSTD